MDSIVLFQKLLYCRGPGNRDSARVSEDSWIQVEVFFQQLGTHLKAALRVLFFLTNAILTRPSHSCQKGWSRESYTHFTDLKPSSPGSWWEEGDSSALFWQRSTPLSGEGGNYSSPPERGRDGNSWTGPADSECKRQKMHADLHEMVHPSQQLSVDGQSAVQLVPRGRYQPHGELSLEHQHGTPEQIHNKF